MSDQATQEQQEFDAIVLQLKRDRRVSYLKFGAFMVLLFVAVTTVVYVTATIPSAVVEIITNGSNK